MAETRVGTIVAQGCEVGVLMQGLDQATHGRVATQWAHSVLQH